MIKSAVIVFFGLLALAITEIKSEGDHAHVSANSVRVDGIEAPPPANGAYDLPPPPAAGVGVAPVHGGLPGGFPGIFGLPGLGFQKSLNINAGAGYGLGGLGGFGVPPVAGGPVGDVPPPPIGGIGLGGLGGLGGFGPSYLPSTWLGSALGAKGDILFPVVIVIFFIVGVWTVIQLLLTLIVPLIAAKIGAVSSIASIKKVRSIEESFDSPDYKTANITSAIEEFCNKYY